MDIQQMFKEPYFTSNELAAKYDVAKETIINWINSGRFVLPDGSSGAYRFPGRGREWRVLKSAVDHYDKQVVTSPTDGE